MQKLNNDIKRNIRFIWRYILMITFLNYNIFKLLNCYIIVSNWVTFLVEEADAEVAHARTVDDGTTQDVTSFL